MKALHKLYTSFLVLLAAATDREMAKMLQYLKEENRTLRGKLPKRIELTARERQRLVKLGKPLRGKLKEVMTIVSPRTFARWVSGETKSVGKRAKAGRRRTEEQLRELIVTIARDLGAGYTRVMGELKKLGIKPPSRNTVKNILKAVGLDPGPQRGESTWDDFLQRHAVSLWQCDFFSRRVLTLGGIRQAFVLAFIHVQTRRVILSPATFKPDAAWVREQADSFVEQARADGLTVARLMRDRDGAFSPAFDEALRRRRVRVMPVPFRAPNTNAYVERYVQSIKQECLDHFLVFGLRHFEYLCREYLAYYLTERPHQGRNNELLLRPPDRRRPRVRPGIDPDQISIADIRCEQRLGGLLKHYYRKAA